MKIVCCLLIVLCGNVSLLASSAASSSSSSALACKTTKEVLKELSQELEWNYQHAQKETKESLKILALNHEIQNVSIRLAHYQANFRNPVLINRLCEYAPIKDLELFNSSLLMRYAVAFKVCQIAKECTDLPEKLDGDVLFGREIDFNQPTLENSYPLLTAVACKKDDSDNAYKNRARLCSYMLARGAQIDIVSGLGNTPLMMGIGNALVTKVILDHMTKTNQLALVNHSNHKGQTALIRAARYVIEHDPASTIARGEPSVAVPLALLKAGANNVDYDNKGNSFDSLKSKSFMLQAAWALFEQSNAAKSKAEDDNGNAKKRKNEDTPDEGNDADQDGHTKKKVRFNIPSLG